jgi:phosphosulfolactate phosphohydrolase-like enzyme
MLNTYGIYRLTFALSIKRGTTALNDYISFFIIMTNQHGKRKSYKNKMPPYIMTSSIYQHNLTFIKNNVSDIMNNYKGVGMSTPSIAQKKCEMLLSDNGTNKKKAFVVIDAIRCSSTILACFGAGVASVSVMAKLSTKGVSIDMAKEVCMLTGAQLSFGGESNGKPINGCIIGNSPLDASRTPEISGKHLHFQSMNFGNTFSEIANQVSDYIDSGGRADIFVASFVNATSVGCFLKNNNYDAVYIACGGFYDCTSLEDEIVGGMILNELGYTFDEIDDDARGMLSIFKYLNTAHKQYAALKTNWVSTYLTNFGKQHDIRSVIFGEGIPNTILKKMSNCIPRVIWVGGIPIITN